MALLKNRHVELTGVQGGEVPTQQFTVKAKDGTQETASLDELTMSDKEHADFTKQHGEHLSKHVKKVSDKDYQEVLDSQDPQKIKAKQAKPVVTK